MASNNNNVGAENNENEDKTINQSFDEVFKLFRSLTDYDGETTSKEFQEKLEHGIKLSEELTNTVTSLEIFSGNESLQELSTNHLKFLLLPFILGSLWQLKTDKDRHDICVASQIYFQDFLQRLFDYKVIKSLPTCMEPDEAKKKAQTLSSDEIRAKKIATLKENKLLDSKIKVLLDRQNEPNFDDELARELYLSVIQKAQNEAVQELSAIAKELELINYSVKMKEAKEGSGGSNSVDTGTKIQPAKKPGIQTFILTRSDLEKKVFGVGYPALPVLTVEELYAQRRAEGIWGPPPSGNQQQQPTSQQEEEEEVATEVADETDDPVRLEQLRRMDEYKDTHRRGWGNRANRS